MTAKDYVYLGLILLVAVGFYWHGFGAGIAVARQRFNRRRPKRGTSSLRFDRDWDEVLMAPPALVAGAVGGSPHSKLLPGDFGKN